MVSIPINICGDSWPNCAEVKKHLEDLGTYQGTVTFAINTEGPSLKALGIVDLLLDWCDATGRSPDSVVITGWHNSLEKIPFTRAFYPTYSHFFYRSRSYWPQSEMPKDTHEFRLACFVGRRTWSRQRIIYDLANDHADSCLLSLMHNAPEPVSRGICLDRFDDWVSVSDTDRFLSWWHKPPLSSIDNLCLKDQYKGVIDTNASLLRHYHKFDLEIAAETYCYGESFYMTEKTVRPIVGNKPMLVFGPRHFLREMRNQGFRTWSDFWDENYDEYEGPERWRRMRMILTELTSMNAVNFLRLIENTKPVQQHNWQRLQHVVNTHWSV